MASPVKTESLYRYRHPIAFYELLETLPAEELAVVKQVRTFHGDEGHTHHHQVLIC